MLVHRSNLIILVAIIFELSNLGFRAIARTQDVDSLQAATRAAAWIRATAVEANERSIWPGIPGDKTTIGPSLYSGAAGPTLFFLEAHHATGDSSYLADACMGADYLLQSIQGEKQFGLYEGLAGTGFVLLEAYQATNNAAYRDGATKCVQLLKDHARRAGAGVEWSDTTDVIAGSAGIGLFLLYSAREMPDDASRELACAAGLRLIELGKAEKGGLKWAMDPRFERLMPNFSHGTAGIAYFLASLYLETKDQRFLDAALAGATYLKAIANTKDSGCLIYHHEPAGEDLFYLGWCHGPPGTARLFYRLYQATEDDAWLSLAKHSADSILQSGIPSKQTPGFWNNVGQCCGSAGVAEFCLEMHRVTQDKRYLEFAQVLTADLLKRATDDGEGMRWMQAEHRVQPDLLHAQTGYMQGAAGIGMWLLHWDEFARGQPRRIIMPDSPF